MLVKVNSQPFSGFCQGGPTTEPVVAVILMWFKGVVEVFGDKGVIDLKDSDFKRETAEGAQMIGISFWIFLRVGMWRWSGRDWEMRIREGGGVRRVVRVGGFGWVRRGFVDEEKFGVRKSRVETSHGSTRIRWLL